MDDSPLNLQKKQTAKCLKRMAANHKIRRQNELIVSDVFYCVNMSVAKNEKRTNERFIKRKQCYLKKKQEQCRQNFAFLILINDGLMTAECRHEFRWLG